MQAARCIMMLTQVSSSFQTGVKKRQCRGPSRDVGCPLITQYMEFFFPRKSNRARKSLEKPNYAQSNFAASDSKSKLIYSRKLVEKGVFFVDRANLLLFVRLSV